MSRFSRPLLAALALAALAALAAFPAAAADNALLIQLQQDGSYRVWHTEGASNLPEPELLELEASARPGGGEMQQSSAGRAQAFEIGDGVVIELPDAPADRRLLLERDLCGGLKVWHAEGATTLSEDDMTELALTALPDGGKLLRIGGYNARGYSVRIGVIAVLWKPSQRPPRLK